MKDFRQFLLVDDLWLGGSGLILGVGAGICPRGLKASKAGQVPLLLLLPYSAGPIYQNTYY